MRTSRRMLLSLGCVVLSITTLFLISLAFGATRSLRPLLEIMPAYFMFALPGWILALPLVVALKDADGWRGWVTLGVGVLLGPAFILAWTLVSGTGQGHIRWNQDGFFLVMSFIVSTLTTFFYLLTLKLTTQRSQTALSQSRETPVP